MLTRILLAFAVTPLCFGETGLSAFEPFHGSWTGAGQFRGAPTKASIQWTPVLGGKFVRLQYAIGPAQSGMQADAYYAANGTGDWFDSQGRRYALRWSVEGKTLRVAWGPDAAAPIGKSEYSLQADGSMEVVDFVGGKEFARLRYAR